MQIIGCGEVATVVEALACPTCGIPAYRVRRRPGSFTGWRSEVGLWHAQDTEVRNCETVRGAGTLPPERTSPRPAVSRWAQQVSNLRPLACKASALPLSYAPSVLRRW